MKRDQPEFWAAAGEPARPDQHFHRLHSTFGNPYHHTAYGVPSARRYILAEGRLSDAERVRSSTTTTDQAIGPAAQTASTWKTYTPEHRGAPIRHIEVTGEASQAYSNTGQVLRGHRLCGCDEIILSSSRDLPATGGPARLARRRLRHHQSTGFTHLQVPQRTQAGSGCSAHSGGSTAGDSTRLRSAPALL